MIPASAELKAAIRAGESARALIHYTEQDAWFPAEYITIDGVRYESAFCAEQNLTIGRTPSASVDYALINRDGMLDDFAFGKHAVYFGARLDSFDYPEQGAAAVAEFGGHRVAAYGGTPYLRAGGEALSVQPAFAPKALISKDGVLYCVGEENALYCVTETDATAWKDVAGETWADQTQLQWKDYEGSLTGYAATVTGEPLKKLLAMYADAGTGITMQTGQDGTVRTTRFLRGKGETYGYVPLGVFYADRPARVRTNVVSVQAWDAMTAVFDQDLTENASVTFPTTLFDLLGAICLDAGIEHKVSPNEPNMGRVITAAADVFQSTTIREAIGFIAEAACANARMDWDGKLAFVWFSDHTDYVIDEHDYSEYVPFEYACTPPTKVQIRNSDSDVGVIAGTGTNAYIIQQNPLLNFATNEEGQPVAQAICDRIRTAPEFVPASCSWFADWTVQPGDVITLKRKGVPHVFPVYTMNLTMNGLAKAEIANTGDEYFPVMDAVNREEYRIGRRMTEISKTVEGLAVTVSGYDAEIGDLAATVQIAADSVSSKVSANGVISAINQSSEQISINASRISLNGAVSLNNKVSIDASTGVLTADAATITNARVTGQLSAGQWVFDDNGATYSSSGYGYASMNIAAASNAFNVSTNGLNAIYGADQDHFVYVYGQTVTLMDTGSGGSVVAGRGTRLSGGVNRDVCLVCGEATAYTPAGNIGTSVYPWDIITYSELHKVSSRKVKTNIEPLPDMGDVIDRLEPVSFNLVFRPEKRDLGLIYEDTVGILPEVCNIPGTEEGIGTISYESLVPVLLREIQSLRRRVSELEKKVN